MNHRKIALLAALLLLTFSLTMLTPPTSEALPACGTHKTYYSDATYTYKVGGKYYDCNGVLQSSWGQVTSYVRTATYCCIAQ